MPVTSGKPTSLTFADLGISPCAGKDDFPPHSFCGELRIGGASFYVDAVEVTGADREGSMTAVNPDMQDRIDAVAQIDAGGDRPGYQTVLEAGRPYFIVIYPYQR